MRLLVIAMLSACLAAGQTRQERGKRAVDEALAALGGDRFLTMRDRVESGRMYSFFREELSGLAVAKVYTRYRQRPADAGPDWIGIDERQAFGKDEYAAVLFTAGTGYEITFRGARPVAEDRNERFRQTVLHDIFYILRQRLNEKGLIFESEGSDVWMNQPVEIVNITDSENRVVKVYFHRSTKLPVRQTFYRRDPKTRHRIEEDVEYGKYRDAGGVQWPYTMLRRRDGERVFQIFSETVQVNQGLADSLFTLPANIKMLKPLR